jgi:hypothetical protein
MKFHNFQLGHLMADTNIAIYNARDSRRMSSTVLSIDMLLKRWNRRHYTSSYLTSKEVVTGDLVPKMVISRYIILCFQHYASSVHVIFDLILRVGP